MLDAIARYLIVAIIVGVLSSLVTYQIVSSSVVSKELRQTKEAIVKKDETDKQVGNVIIAHEAVKQKQEEIKEKVRIKYETIVKTETVYRDAACSLTTDGVQLLDSTADSLNSTRIKTDTMQKDSIIQ